MPDQPLELSRLPKVCLASASPVRAQLLKAAGVVFDVEPADINEDDVKARYIGRTAPRSLAAELAELKALEVSRRQTHKFVLGADQTLDCDGDQFDKPSDMAAARKTLLRLRGRRHTLTAAVCIARDGEPVWEHEEVAGLEMRPFSDQFLEHYLEQASDSILTSVGAYRLEELGGQLFSAIDGDYFTVLGLPLLPVLEFFRRQGVLSQ